MYRCKRWMKKAEHHRIDAFQLWCWRKLLRVSWTARRSNQSILKEISPEYPLEGLMLKLKLHYFGHLIQRTDSFEKTLMLGKIEGRRRRGWQRMRWLDGITDSTDMGLGGQGGLACCSPWGCKESDMTEWLNWVYTRLVLVFVAQSCPTLCDPMDSSPQGSSVHGILSVKILEWVTISCSRGSSHPQDQTQVSRIAGRFFTPWVCCD